VSGGTREYDGSDTSGPVAGAGGGAGHALLDALFRQSSLGIAVYDAAGRVVFGNRVYERHFGIRLADVPADYSLLADPQLDAAGLLPLIRRAYDGEPVVLPPVSYDAAQAARGSGRTVWTQGHCYPVRDAAGAVTHVAIVHADVTAWATAREELREAAAERVRLHAAERAAREQAEAARERTARLQTLTAELSMAATREEVARRVVAHATAVFGAVGIVIACLSPDGEQLEIVDVGDMPADVREEWRRFPLGAPTPLSDVARSGEPLFLESPTAWIARYPHLAPLLDATGHRANAVLPLVVEGRLLGVLGAAFDVPRTFDDDDRSTAAAVAHLCAQSLERTRLFEAERTARREAEAANQAKSQFLAVMSHELRTPLNAIDGYAELMELGIRGPVTDQQREDLARIRKSQRHLLGLINGVLNYSRIEAGAVRYLVETVPLDETLAMCEALIAPQARSRRLTLAFGGCDAALRVRGDGEKVQQIVLNLLSNAVKFTEPGGRVELACTPREDVLAITVSDTGRGIAPDRLEHVFEPFVQVDASRTRTQEGIGLGLAISRDLARGMGGDLTADSRAGEGSVFTLTLPRVRDE
jgi:PAS domain S-box-containing protein